MRLAGLLMTLRRRRGRRVGWRCVFVRLPAGVCCNACLVLVLFHGDSHWCGVGLRVWRVGVFVNKLAYAVYYRVVCHGAVCAVFLLLLAESTFDLMIGVVGLLMCAVFRSRIRSRRWVRSMMISTPRLKRPTMRRFFILSVC